MRRVRIILPLLVLVAFISTGCNRCRYGCENGICQNQRCVCESFWEGDACERSVLAQYAGTYLGTNSCVSSADPIEYVFGLNSNPMEAKFGELQLTFVSTNHFEVPEQIINGKRLIGEGQMQLNRISISYEEISAPNGGKCLIEASLVDN